RARLDDFNPMYVTAGSWFYRASYALFGVGIRQTRFPSIALAALTVLLIGFGWMRRSPLAGAAGAVLLGTTYLYTAYSRLGLLDMPAAALAVAGLIAVIAAVERGRATIVLGAIGGALLAAGIAVKIQTAAPIVGAVAGLIA